MKSIFGNRSAERDIRDWLTSQGYSGKTASFVEIELHAIQRPGWFQVFRFEVHCLTADEEKTQLYGSMKSDERYGGPEIEVSPNIDVRDATLANWSDGLIMQRKHRRP